MDNAYLDAFTFPNMYPRAIKHNHLKEELLEKNKAQKLHCIFICRMCHFIHSIEKKI